MVQYIAHENNINIKYKLIPISRTRLRFTHNEYLFFDRSWPRNMFLLSEQDNSILIS